MYIWKNVCKQFLKFDKHSWRSLPSDRDWAVEGIQQRKSIHLPVHLHHRVSFVFIYKMYLFAIFFRYCEKVYNVADAVPWPN